MQDERVARTGAHQRLEPVEVKRQVFVTGDASVRRADGYCQTVAAGLGDEAPGQLRRGILYPVGKAVVLHAGDGTQLSLEPYTALVRVSRHLSAVCGVFLEAERGAVVHDRAEAAVYRQLCFLDAGTVVVLEQNGVPCSVRHRA